MAQTPKKAALLFQRSLTLSNCGDDDCIIWTFARNHAGYAVFGKPRGAINSSIVSRVVCEAAYGMPPDKSFQAAHSCGNGDKGCVNPHHISWKTPLDNSADQIIHGTRNRGARNGMSRLGIDQVRELRRLRGKMSQRKLAELFGIDQSTVSDIQRGKRWGWAT